VSEKLCIFCKHFKWSTERAWGMGSTQTGPMYEGGDATCAAGQYTGDWENGRFLEDEDDFRKIILRGEKCEKYERP
jgi:hypothetical protein